MRTRLMRSKFTLLFVACAIVLAIPAIALADNAVADGDGAVAFNDSNMALGSVCSGVESSRTAPVKITRQGNATATNTFANNATVTVTAQVTGAGLSAEMASPNTITLPSNWDVAGNGALSDSVSSTVKLNSSVAGPGSGSVVYTAKGLNSSGVEISRTDTMNVTWTTSSCDTTAPTSSASATIPNGSGTSAYSSGAWTNQNVTVALSGQDNTGGSGVKEIRYTTDGTAPTKTTGTVYTAPFTVSSTTTVKYLAVDNAGNAGAVNTFHANIDKTAPVANCGSADGAWHADDVSIACSPTDTGGSGLASSTPATFNLSTSVAAGTENASASTDSRTISDAAGNTATAGPIGGNKIDKKAPTVLPADVTNTTWRNSSLSQDFTSSDGGSGLATAGDGSFTLTASLESANATTPTVVSRDVKDAVGNTTTRSLSALIDLTDPTIDASVTNDPAPSGWYNIDTGGPVVHFECGDLLSGIAAGACPADHTITTDGPNQGYSDSVSDRAGNTSSDGVSGLKVDLTAPDVAGAPNLLASSDSGDNDDDLTNDKTPTFDITAEAGSTVKLYAEKNGTETLLGSATATNGVAQITSGQELSDGTYNVYAKVTDQAGNVSSTNGINVTIVTIDATAPGAPGLDMAAASDTGVSNSDDKTNNATPTFGGAAEAGSTVKLYDGANLLTSIQVGAGGSWSFTPASALSEGAHPIKATATDAADNTSSVSQLSVVIDLTNPVVTLGSVSGTAGSPGWYTSVVTQTFNASDTGGTGIDGLASFTKSSGTNEEGSNVTILSGSVSDVAGNTNPGISAGPFKIDLSNPYDVAFVGGPAAGNSYYFGNVPAEPTCSAKDDVSGLKDCVVTGYSNAVGTHTMTATATDNAGRTKTETRTYTVLAWTTKGFYQPVDMGGVFNTVKGGSTVPLKFELFSGATELTDTTAIKSLQYVKVNCDTSAPTDAIEETVATGGTTLRYDATGGQFIYNWKSPTGAACYKVTMTAADGSTIIAFFKSLK